jgi:hypothetical protein
MRNHPQSIPSI